LLLVLVLVLLHVLVLVQQQCQVVLLVHRWSRVTAERHLPQSLEQRRWCGPLLLLGACMQFSSCLLLLLLLLLLLSILQLPGQVQQ
jgi:hypothetical protein